MDIGRGSFVHQLGLALRIEILRNVPYDAEQFTLPWREPRRRLLKEVQEIFLRQAEQIAAAFGVQLRAAFGRPARNCPPQIVEGALLVLPPPSGALLLGAQV